MTTEAQSSLPLLLHNSPLLHVPVEFGVGLLRNGMLATQKLKSFIIAKERDCGDVTLATCSIGTSYLKLLNQMNC